MTEIRRLGPEDWEQYRELRLRALAEHPEAFAASHRDELAMDAAGWRRRLALEGMSFTLGAIAGAGLVGTVTFVRESREKLAHKGNLAAMYVEPSSRCAGVGSALVRELVERVRALRGVERINLSVVATNVAARALYERHGFVVFGEERRALRVGEAYHDEVHMVLALSAYPDRVRTPAMR